MAEQELMSWQRTWREGFAKILPSDGLVALYRALHTDDPRLTQGSTTTPPPLMCVADWPCEAADAIGFCGVVANGGWKNANVGQVEEFFAKACFDSDQLLDEPAGCRHFLNWFDDTPRDEMRRQLMIELVPELIERGRVADVARLVSGMPDAPLDIVADWLGDHDHTALETALRDALVSWNTVPQN